MNIKQNNKSIMCVFIATFVLSSVAVYNTNPAFAFMDFLLGDDESDTGSSTNTTSSAPASAASSDNAAIAAVAPEDQTPSSSYTKSQSSSSLQSAECYSPHGNIIDSCNSGELSDSIDDDSYIASSEYQYQYQYQ